MVTITTPFTKDDIKFLRMILSQNEDVVMMEDKNISMGNDSRKWQAWTAQEMEILLKEFQQGKSLVEIAESIPGRDAKSCGNKLNSMGLFIRKK